jgi:hypothetical protein
MVHLGYPTLRGDAYAHGTSHCGAVHIHADCYLVGVRCPRRDTAQCAGVDEAEYRGRLKTLSSFAKTAGDEYYDQPTTGAARYAVVRKETGVLFAELNSSLGTDLQLP